jgi:hypothetical protein
MNHARQLHVGLHQPSVTFYFGGPDRLVSPAAVLRSSAESGRRNALHWQKVTTEKPNKVIARGSIAYTFSTIYCWILKLFILKTPSYPSG